MAVSNKNILITPATNVADPAVPRIVFSGADASTANQDITLNVYPQNGGTLSFEGSNGQLFSINNSVTGTIYSVNDVSGIPSIEVLDTGLIKFAQYSGNVVLGSAIDDGKKFQVTGTSSYSGDSLYKVNARTVYGPNTSWSSYLYVGGDGVGGITRTGSIASIVTTNGNMHIDSGSDKAMYFNFYSGTGGVQFGNGASGVVATVSAAGVFSGNGSGLTSLTGANVSGTVSSATYATNSSKLYSTDAGYAYGSGAPYYGYLTYDGTRWLLQVSPATPAAVRVAYADSAGSAPASDVYTWAKASTKPSYTAADVGAPSGSGTCSGTNTGDQTNISGYAGSVYGAGGNYISRTTSGTAYSSGIQVREAGLGGAQGSVMAYAPMLAFHWSGVVASSIMMEPSGRIGIYNNPGTGYEAFVCGNEQNNSLGVGTGPSGTAGEIRATNNITAYYSDDRLKTRTGNIENALDKISTLDTFYYYANETAQALGYKPIPEVGISAQQVQVIMPQVVAPAPIDDRYLTVRYEKLVPLLIAAIKEQQAIIDSQEQRLARLEALINKV